MQETMEERYSFQTQVARSENSFARADVTKAEFQESYNQGVVVFCAVCEDYYTEQHDDGGKCFKCRGFVEVKA